MSEIKKRVFIGSSSESEKVAYLVKNQIERTNPAYECVVWSEGNKFYGLSESTYEALFKKVATFEYAIFVAGPDDTVTRNETNEEKVSARDNVYFEIGLFGGALGRTRVYIMGHKDCTLASDFKGVTVVKYNDTILEESEDAEKMLVDCCQRIIDEMNKEKGQPRLSIRPSTALATGYFENFIKPVAQALSDETAKLGISKDDYDLKDIAQKQVIVIIPEIESSDLNGWYDEFVKEKGLRRGCTIKSEDRTLRVTTNPEVNKELLTIYDVPTTLQASFYAVNELLSAGYFGTDEEIVLRDIEIWNFRETLQRKINDNYLTRRFVRIEEYKLQIDKN